MKNEEPRPDDQLPPPGKYGRMTILPPAERGNPKAEELTWPVVSPGRRTRGTFFAEPVRGNPTAEELTWPVVETGNTVIFGAGVAPPTSESPIHPVEHELVELLQKLTAAERAPVLRRLQQLLLSHQSA